jgi:light-harvesting complex 1 beta chain
MDNETLSGLSESEAAAFGAVFFRAFLGFVVIALIAHFLVWQWRPWRQP